MDCPGWSFNHQISLSDVSSTLYLLVSIGTLVVSYIALKFAVEAGRKVDKDWREQRRLDRKADVATEALVAFFTMADFLHNMAIAMDPDKASLLDERVVETRWAPFTGPWNQLWLARVKVEAFIPSVYALFKELQDYTMTLRDAQIACTEQKQSVRENQLKFESNLKLGYGATPRAEIDALRLKTKEALMPYARHEK